MGTWIKQQGENSRSVRVYMARFTRELARAATEAGCPLALGPRQIMITRYGARPVERTSLESGGRLVEAALVASGLLSEGAGHECIMRQASDSSAYANLTGHAVSRVPLPEGSRGLISTP